MAVRRGDCEKNFSGSTMRKLPLKLPYHPGSTETVANTKLYYNNNGTAANTNDPAGCTPLPTDGSAELYKLSGTANQPDWNL